MDPLVSSVPPLAERLEPGLSETLTGPKDPRRCQACGFEVGPPRNDVERVVRFHAYLSRWIECDAWDRHDENSPVVVLCEPCSKKLIESHPRLYVDLWPDTPRPGCMPICVDCTHRSGVSCTHPRAKANGGEAVLLKFKHPPTRAHLCYQAKGGGRRGETRWMFSPVEACRQKELAP